jgi:hypothetical protein
LLCGSLNTALAQTGGIAAVDSSAPVATSARPDSSQISALGSSPTSSNIDRRAVPGVFDFITNLPMDWRDWAVDNIQLKYWPQISLIAASTAALIIYDNQLWTPLAKEYNRNKTFQATSDLFVDIGDGRFQFGLAGAYIAYGLAANDKRAVRTASQICEVILASGGVVQLLKHVTGRESPIDITINPTGRWDWFPNQLDYLHHTSHYDAFPSGHLTTVLATLTVIANNYPEQAWIKPVGYVACVGVSMGLVAQSIHWWSDYPLAIALGIGFGNLLSPNPDADVSVPDPSKKKEMGAVGSGINTLLSQTTIVPTLQPDGGGGLAMIVRF